MPNPATDRQKDYIRDLIDIHDLTDEQRTQALCLVETISKESAGKWIDRLKSLPRRPNGKPNGGTYSARGAAWHVEFKEVGTDNDETKRIGFMAKDDSLVPRGSYALMRPDDDLNGIHFFKLWIGDRGGWNIRRVVGPDEYPLIKSVQQTILDEIARDPREAANLYGEQIGRCGVCNRRLTRTESRNRGIGPICAQNWGW